MGQGFANAVGMALAEELLSAQFNRPGFELVDHHTYVFMGDGCMMEGISYEVASFAGTIGLSKLIAFYDDNGISIDSEKGQIAHWYTDERAQALQRLRLAGHPEHRRPRRGGGRSRHPQGEKRSKGRPGRPTLICCKTVIAKGSAEKGQHGSRTWRTAGRRRGGRHPPAIGWPYAPFEIPEAVRAGWMRARRVRRPKRSGTGCLRLTKQFPAEAAEFQRRLAGNLPQDFDARIGSFVEELNGKAETLATRKASQNVLEVLKPMLPEPLGGSADLTGSNLTMVKASKAVVPGFAEAGNHIFYGVREFGMCAIMSGIALHRGFIPYGGTFLVFSDYARNALRMAALMKIRVVYVFTHDSIGLGEDGPTHQPIEHAASLRLIPNMDVWRPADTVETAVAWAAALRRKDGPTALLLSRQNVAFSKRTTWNRTWRLCPCGRARGPGRVIATGSEVPIASGRKSCSQSRACRPGGFHAVNQPFRPPGRGLQELGPAA